MAAADGKLDRVRRAKRELDRLERRRATATDALHAAIVDAVAGATERQAGEHSYAQVAAILGVSRQYVAQIVARHRRLL